VGVDDWLREVHLYQAAPAEDDDSTPLQEAIKEDAQIDGQER
jgi:hypothetical protein